MRISAGQRQQNEARIRAAIDRLLAGDIPPGGKCDIKTLAREAAVDRAAFYGTRPYARLREEFEARHQARQQAGDIWTPTGFVDTIRSGTMVYEERTGSGTGSQEVHPGI